MPSEEIVREVLAIMRNGDIYWEARALAADVLCHVAGRREGIGGDLAREVVEATKAFLAGTQPPQSHDAITESAPRS